MSNRFLDATNIFRSCAGFEEWGWAEPLGANLFVVFFLVKLRGVAETKNLTVGVASQGAMGPLRFQGNDGDVPRTSTEGGSYAATRKPLERFELKDRRRRLDVIQIQRASRNCHSAPPVAGRPCNLDARYLG